MQGQAFLWFCAWVELSFARSPYKNFKIILDFSLSFFLSFFLPSILLSFLPYLLLFFTCFLIFQSFFLNIFQIYPLTSLYWRRQWRPTPVLLPGKSHGRRSLVGSAHGVTRSRTQLSDFTFTFHFPALEKEMATHSSVLAWRIPGMGEPGRLPSTGSCIVGPDWSDLAAAAAAAAPNRRRGLHRAWIPWGCLTGGRE